MTNNPLAVLPPPDAIGTPQWDTTGQALYYGPVCVLEAGGEVWVTVGGVTVLRCAVGVVGPWLGDLVRALGGEG